MKRATKRPTVAEMLAALPAAMWLYDQALSDTRARGFVPEATTPADLAKVARDVVRACAALKPARRKP